METQVKLWDEASFQKCYVFELFAQYFSVMSPGNVLETMGITGSQPERLIHTKNKVDNKIKYQ